MIASYSSHGSAENFVNYAEGVLEFLIKEIKENDPQAKIEIDSLETALDYVSSCLDEHEPLEELEKET